MDSPSSVSESTIRRRCGCAIQFFEHAVRLQLIEQNPFKSKRIPTTLPRPKQKAFIDSKLAFQMMNELPNWEYRLVFALARWGGVRVPSEPNALLWSHVDWSRDRLTIPSPKTERYPGREQRVIPIFPELRQPLQDAWDASEKGQGYILAELRQVTSAALTRPMLAAIASAGGQPWSKLWTALRATRVTELRDRYPGHVVVAWLGHNEKIAQKNYTQVTDEHFARAVQGVKFTETGKASGLSRDHGPLKPPTARS